MSEEKPTVYILHGDDRFALSQIKASLTEKMDPATADLNITQLDGQTNSYQEIHSAVNAIPFLADRRIVFIENPLAKIKPTDKEAQSQFLSLLEHVPPTTALVMVIADEHQGGKRGWKVLGEKSWLRMWIVQAGNKVHMQTKSRPTAREMTGWIKREARELGGKFSTDAAIELAAHVGANPRFAHQEIIKLLTYVDYQRAVEIEDVKECTPLGMHDSIFDLIDHMTAGRVTTAVKIFRGLLEQQDPYSLFGMVVRQFRLLLQAREILDEGGSAASFSSELGLHPYAAEKIRGQVHHFPMTRLRDIYHQLLEIDEAAKTGKMSLELGLEIFIAELGR